MEAASSRLLPSWDSIHGSAADCAIPDSVADSGFLTVPAPLRYRHRRTPRGFDDMPSRFLAAAIQICAGSDKQANFARAESLARVAAGRGASLIVLPEVFSWRGAREEEQRALARQVREELKKSRDDRKGGS